MNKSDLFEIVGKKFKHLPSREVEKIIQKIFSSIVESLSSGKRVEIRGFGTFSIKNRKERVGRNPKTGVTATINARRVISFKPSKLMKERINKSEKN